MSRRYNAVTPQNKINFMAAKKKAKKVVKKAAKKTVKKAVKKSAKRRV